MVMSRRINGPFKGFCQIESLDRLTDFMTSNHLNNQLVSWFRITEPIKWFYEFESPGKLNGFMTSNLWNVWLVSDIRTTWTVSTVLSRWTNPLCHAHWDIENVCHFRSRSTFLKNLGTLIFTIVWTRHRFSSIPRLEPKLIEPECSWSYWFFF